jgi:hypothetical protein
MSADAAFREEEHRFLGDMPAVPGAEAVSALVAISRRLGSIMAASISAPAATA